MKQLMTLDVARDFSKTPAGRYISDGPTSGQTFRAQKLVPALESAERVRIILDGAEGYGSSFLEEAFAGLLRETNISADDFFARIEFVSDEDPTLVDEIRGYVLEQHSRLHANR